MFPVDALFASTIPPPPPPPRDSTNVVPPFLIDEAIPLFPLPVPGEPKTPDPPPPTVIVYCIDEFKIN
jgi:hypothetical protein